MQITLLRTFLAVAEGGSFRQAAEALNITQPAVTSRLQQLEESLGVALFERGRHGARLTDAGRHLRPHAESMVRSWHIVSDDLYRRFSGHLSLRIGAQLSIWNGVLLDITLWIGERLGKLPITASFDHQTDAQSAVREGLLDFVLTNRAPAAGLEGIRLTSEPLRLVSDRPFTPGRDQPPLFIDCQFGPEVDAAARALFAEDAPRHVFLCNCAMGLEYIRRKGGMIFVPQSMAEEDVAAGRLAYVKGVEPVDIPLYGVWLPDSPARRTIDLLVAEFLGRRTRPH